MNSRIFQQHCRRISLTDSATYTAALLEACNHTSPKAYHALQVKMALESWHDKTLSDHEFMHRVKAAVSPHILPRVHDEAFRLAKCVIEGGKAITILKNSGLSRPDSNYDAKELALGRKSEREHTTSDEAADIIAKDHLDEDKAYYSKLLKIEKS
jgi:hypothetical protein